MVLRGRAVSILVRLDATVEASWGEPGAGLEHDICLIVCASGQSGAKQSRVSERASRRVAQTAVITDKQPKRTGGEKGKEVVDRLVDRLTDQAHKS